MDSEWIQRGFREDLHMDSEWIHAWIQNVFIHGFRVDSYMDSEWNHEKAVRVAGWNMFSRTPKSARQWAGS